MGACARKRFGASAYRYGRNVRRRLGFVMVRAFARSVRFRGHGRRRLFQAPNAPTNGNRHPVTTYLTRRGLLRLARGAQSGALQARFSCAGTSSKQKQPRHLPRRRDRVICRIGERHAGSPSGTSTDARRSTAGSAFACWPTSRPARRACCELTLSTANPRAATCALAARVARTAGAVAWGRARAERAHLSRPGIRGLQLFDTRHTARSSRPTSPARGLALRGCAPRRCAAPDIVRRRRRRGPCRRRVSARPSLRRGVLRGAGGCSSRYEPAASSSCPADFAVRRAVAGAGPAPAGARTMRRR